MILPENDILSKIKKKRNKHISHKKGLAVNMYLIDTEILNLKAKNIKYFKGHQIITKFL